MGKWMTGSGCFHLHAWSFGPTSLLVNFVLSMGGTALLRQHFVAVLLLDEFPQGDSTVVFALYCAA